ncbi:SGNH/GDSL hydrolase family protein [Streptomyces sp. NPDC057694]|uniref:SGNH/GDSL hydrolase family protein n=1 Tax=Streptomyces sp. NPDC057694 TaxID=3346216 RepID=UPI0036812000
MTLHHPPAPARAALAAAGAVALFLTLAQPAGATPGTTGDLQEHYVALGDSYSSGLGIPTQTDADCGRSDSDYPSLVAGALNVADFTDVTCAGATTADMTQPQDSAPPQLDALRPDTTLVTLGVGGNDLDLTGVVTQCVLVGYLAPNGAPCKLSYTPLGSDIIGNRIKDVGSRIDAVLKEIHVRSPRARVLVVGYPGIVPDDGSACRDLIPFATGDFPWFRDKEKQLNSLLAEQAGGNDAGYVDLYGPSVGHDACQSEGVRWIEPQDTEQAAGFHPNAAGHRSAAGQVLAALSR